ncbi:MAG: type III-B CRISPR-associated protein Cas10/Cmr2, partial [Chloracidobacterium sp.]
AQAKHEAHQTWLAFANEAYEEAAGAIRQDIWGDQVDDVIEFYAAWVARTDPSPYQSDRARLMRLLAGRKNCRDFAPAKGRAGVPKSSLDGQRESVLKDPAREPWPERLRTQLRIRKGEQLDVVGLVKRVAGGKRPYPSVSRVAADPWIRGNKQKPSFGDLVEACKALPKHVLHHLDEEHFPQFQDFPYEGTVVFKSRHHEWRSEIDEEDWPTSIGQIQDALGKLSEPSPYLAVLVADGDRVGAAIAALASPDAHRDFSENLSGFAKQVHTIVNANRGVLVYAGGDDVLAFLPVDKCLDCARQLHDDFGRRLAMYGNLSLSVGIAIGHFMENLEDLLEYGRAAEKAAKKPDRDGLAVHLHKRGGAPIQIRSPWQDQPDQRLKRYAELLRREAIPSKLPYDLRKLADVYDGWPKETLAQALCADVLRVIRDKQPKAGRHYLEEIEQLVRTRLTDATSLRRFTEEVLIAHQIAMALEQAEAPSVTAEEVAR